MDAKSRTQLQMRIDEQVRTGQRFPINTYFAERHPALRGYENNNFLGEGDVLSHHVFEEDIKTGNSYDEIRPAVQARLAHMEFCDEMNEIYKMMGESKYEFLGKVKGFLKLNLILKRNRKLRRKAVDRVYRERGGFKWLWSNELQRNLMKHVDKVVPYVNEKILKEENARDKLAEDLIEIGSNLRRFN